LPVKMAVGVGRLRPSHRGGHLGWIWGRPRNETGSEFRLQSDRLELEWGHPIPPPFVPSDWGAYGAGRGQRQGGGEVIGRVPCVMIRGKGRPWGRGGKVG